MLLRVHGIIITIIIDLIPFLSIYELGNFHLSQTVSVMMMMMIIIVIIIISINCNWVVTRWQWLFYMYTKYEADY